MTEVAMALDRAAPVIQVRPELLHLLDGLPSSKQIELLDFARFLYRQATVESVVTPRVPHIELRTAPATTLVGLTGLVQLGGDAIADVEALYDDDSNR